MADKGLALVTGASTGIGFELARLAVEDGWQLLAVADEARLEVAAADLGASGGTVETLRADLATRAGMDALRERVDGREVTLFFANAGRALGHAFHDQDLDDIRRLIDLDIRQTTLMLHFIGRKMRARGRGRILVVGSIGGDVPGPFDAVYDAAKAYVNSLAFALREELKDTAVTVTCLMPGPTETLIFERAGMGDAPIADSSSRDDPADVARAGYRAMMRGEAGTVPGFTNKLIRMFSGLVPNEALAELHRRCAEPGRG